MTLIITQINKFGIVFGADSNISNDYTVIKEGQKIFEIPRLKAAMCTAGSYTVNSNNLDVWLPSFISSPSSKYSTMGDFATLLSQTLEKKMTSIEKKNCFITHIAGYYKGHPEMWQVSNTDLEGAEYTEGKDNFHYSEDLWNRDWKRWNLENLFKSVGLNYYVYANGFPSGRIAFNVVIKFIDNYFNLMWQQRSFGFRPPKNIGEHKKLVETYINLIRVLFQLSDREPKMIGGKTQTCTIENPNILR